MPFGKIINKKPYEKIEYLLRRDLVTFVPYIFYFIVLVVLEVILFLMLLKIFPTVFSNNIGKAAGILLGSIYTLSIWLFFYTSFIDYYLDIWVITNDRIIDIRQEGLFGRTIAEVELFRVQDVTSECKGIFSTMFDFGRVYVQTAAEKERFVFNNVPRPHFIREEIIRLADIDRQFHASNVK